jgi:hypothetical protein
MIDYIALKSTVIAVGSGSFAIDWLQTTDVPEASTLSVIAYGKLGEDSVSAIGTVNRSDLEGKTPTEQTTLIVDALTADAVTRFA